MPHGELLLYFVVIFNRITSAASAVMSFCTLFGIGTADASHAAFLLPVKVEAYRADDGGYDQNDDDVCYSFHIILCL